MVALKAARVRRGGHASVAARGRRGWRWEPLPQQGGEPNGRRGAAISEHGHCRVMYYIILSKLAPVRASLGTRARRPADGRRAGAPQRTHTPPWLSIRVALHRDLGCWRRSRGSIDEPRPPGVRGGSVAGARERIQMASRCTTTVWAGHATLHAGKNEREGKEGNVATATQCL